MDHRSGYCCRLHESDVGFVILVDRRLDKWGSVKSLLLRISVSPSDSFIYVADKATYIRLLHGKIGILEGFFGPSSVHRGRTQIVLG